MCLTHEVIKFSDFPIRNKLSGLKYAAIPLLSILKLKDRNKDKWILDQLLKIILENCEYLRLEDDIKFSKQLILVKFPLIVSAIEESIILSTTALASIYKLPIVLRISSACRFIASPLVWITELSTGVKESIFNSFENPQHILNGLKVSKSKSKNTILSLYLSNPKGNLIDSCSKILDNSLTIIPVSYTHLTLPTNREV